MNNQIQKTALAILRSTKFHEEFAAELRAKKEARDSFVASETFTRMVEAFKGQTAACSVNTEDANYFFDEVRRTAGWDFATKEDVSHFFDIVGDSNSPGVEPGSVHEDEECPFDNCHFRNMGMSVSRLPGQGTIITITNR